MVNLRTLAGIDDRVEAPDTLMPQFEAQAGAQPISWVSLACELQRDWGRVETVPDVVDIVLTTRLLATA